MTTLLVIEPDEEAARTVSMSLTAPNRHVDVVSSGTSAIAWADAHGPPDFAVIDLELPDLSPMTVVAALEARIGHRLTRFFVSRGANAGVRFGGAPLLAAPFEPSGVRAALAEAVIECELRS